MYPTSAPRTNTRIEGGGRNYLLEDWTTVRGNTASVGTVTQARELWLNVPQFADATFWIDVAEVTAPSSGLVILTFETSPTPDETCFQPVGGIVPLVASATPTVVRSTRSGTTVPFSRYLRWKITTTGSGAWDATFRVRVVGNRTSYWVPTQLSGCLLWVRSDLGLSLSNTNVNNWNDSSGSGVSSRNLAAGATPPTLSASGAINAAVPAIHFTGSQLLAATSALWTGAATRSLFAVYKPSTTGAGNLEVAGQTGTEATAQWFELECVPASGDPYIACWADDIAGPAANTNAKWALATYDGSQLALYSSGTLSGTKNFTAATNNEPFRVGVGWSGSAFIEFFQGDIGEVIAFNRVLTGAERTSVQSYIHAYWGI